MKRLFLLTLLVAALQAAAQKTFTAADSVAMMSRRFATPSQAALTAARARLNNAQWSYALPAEKRSAVAQVLPFAKNRPTVVVLIHGITGYPTTDPKIGTLKGARNYWGYDFIYGLLGATQDKPATFASDAAVLSIGKPEWETKLVNDAMPAHHFITIYGKPKPEENFYTPFSLMLTYRDGSQSVKRQVAQTAAQIVSLYESTFGSWPEESKPQLILLGHSFGGLIARAICSGAPNIPSNESAIPAESFSPEDRANMDFIRNRTVYITTLATPHEGSPITWNAAMGSVLQEIPYLFTQIDESDPDAYVIRQLSPGFVKNLNNTVLSPEKCKRADGSLVPIHALGGRVPAGPDYFRNPNQSDNDLGTIDGGIGTANVDRVLADGSNRDKYECYNLVRVDYAMHMFFGGPTFRPWGATPADGADLDRIRISDVQPATNCLVAPIYNPASFFTMPRLFYLRSAWMASPGGTHLTCQRPYVQTGGAVQDGEIDSDGFVPINSSLGVNLGNTQKNYFDHTRNGSWYRFYSSAADFDNHGTIKFREEVGVWLREKIIGNTVGSLGLAHTLDLYNSSGPKVTAGGTHSGW